MVLVCGISKKVADFQYTYFQLCTTHCQIQATYIFIVHYFFFGYAEQGISFPVFKFTDDFLLIFHPVACVKIPVCQLTRWNHKLSSQEHCRELRWVPDKLR